MKINSLEKLYVYELKKLYSGEQQSLKLLTALVEQVNRPELTDLLQQQNASTRQRISRIEQIFTDLKFSPAGQKNTAVSGLITAAKQAIAATHTPALGDRAIILGWQRLQDHLRLSYQQLHHYAQQLQREQDSALLNQSLDEIIASESPLLELIEALQQDKTDFKLSYLSLRYSLQRLRARIQQWPLFDAAEIGLIILGSVMIAGTVLSFFPFSAWWVRIFDFPRGQLAVLGLGVAAAYYLLRYRQEKTDYLFLAALAFCVGYQVYRVHPYTLLSPPQLLTSTGLEVDSRFRLMIANVLMDNRNVSGLRKIIADNRPDLILLTETDDWWLEQLAPLEQNFPHTVLYPLDNTYGIALYSRLELINPKVRFLIQQDIPSLDVQFKLPNGQLIHLYGLHPRPPSPSENYRSTERDAELLMTGLKIRDETDPVIVAGDLNDVAWSNTSKHFQRISQLRDPRIGRGVYPTFHARYPLLRWPLDHVFVSDQLRLVQLQQLPDFASDHFPISIALSHEPENEEYIAGPPAASEQDITHAREIIAQARERNPS